MKKKIILTLTVLCLALCLCSCVKSKFATTSEPQPFIPEPQFVIGGLSGGELSFGDIQDNALDKYDIFEHSVTLNNNVWLTYFVPNKSLSPDVKEKGVDVWTDFSKAESKSSPDYKCVYYDVVKNEDGDTFDTYFLTDLSYKNLVDIVYARPYYVVDGQKIYGDIDKYSLLQYCHDYYNLEEKYDENGTITISEMIKATIEYATACQKFYGYKLNQLAKDELYKYGIAHIEETDQIFTSGEELKEFFEEKENDTEDFTLIFDLPLTIEDIYIGHWKHNLTIDSVAEVKITSFTASICSGKIEISNLNIKFCDAETTIFSATNCTFDNLLCNELRECVLTNCDIIHLSVYGVQTATATNCNFNTNPKNKECVFVVDSQNLTFEDCTFSNGEIAFLDDHFGSQYVLHAIFNNSTFNNITFGGRVTRTTTLIEVNGFSQMNNCQIKYTIPCFVINGIYVEN